MYYLVVSYFFVIQNIAVFPDAGLSPGLCRLSALFLVPDHGISKSWKVI